jgi:predicted amidohydrolase
VDDMKSFLRIAVVSLRHGELPVPMGERFSEVGAHVEEAGKKGCDFLLLPEHFATHGTRELADGSPRKEFAEPVPGPTCDRLGKLARKAGLGIAGGILEKDGSRLFNTVVVINAHGNLVGCYRKTHPTASEVRLEGIVPGQDLPVFEFPFGTVGVMNCMDLYFPEVARILALRGARMLLWPTVAHGPTAEQLELLCRARALENGAFVASANFAGDPPYAPYAGRPSMGRAFVIDPDGVIIADTGHRPGLVTAEVNLFEPRRTVSVVGFRASGRDILPDDFFAMRRPEIYQELCKPIDNRDYLEGRERSGT